MEADFTSTPEAFEAASRKKRLEYLRSLTLETAAEDLEDILSFQAELLEAGEALGLPPPLPNPLPGPTLAILLEGKPSEKG